MKMIERHMTFDFLPDKAEQFEKLFIEDRTCAKIREGRSVDQLLAELGRL